MSRQDRLLNAAGAGACIFALVFAVFWLQEYLGLEPCPLCVLDRVVFAGAAVLFAAAAIHGPGAIGRRIYAGLTLAVLLVGVSLAARHVYLQHLPADQVPACGPSLGYMLEIFPLTEALSMVLRGAGSCAEIHATFLGFSIPEWTLVVFMALSGVAAWLLFHPEKR